MCRGDERNLLVRAARERAEAQGRGPYTIWTDGSKLGHGGVGVGIAWYEEVPAPEAVGSVLVSRRGFARQGKEEKEGDGPTRADADPMQRQGPGGEGLVLAWERPRGL